MPCEIDVDHATVFVASLIEPDPMGQWSLTGTISKGPLAEGLAMTLQACFRPEVGGFYASQCVA